MGWSIDPKYVSEQKKSHDRFFAELGKALYLASMFEAKCRFVLQIVKLVSHIEDSGDDLLEAFRAVALQPRQMLRQTINGLKTPLDLSPAKIEALIDAVRARNYIAHDFGSIGPATYLRHGKLIELRASLRERLNVLVVGDSIASSWVYEIEEKQPAPVHYVEYRAWVMTWIFGDEPRLSRAEPSDVKALCQYARIPYLAEQECKEHIVLDYGCGHGTRTTSRGDRVIHVDLTLIDDAPRQRQAIQVLEILGRQLDCVEARLCLGV